MPSPPPQTSLLQGRSMLAVPVVFVLATLGHLARLPMAAWDTMYAEDGDTFLRGAATGQSGLFTPYDGYQHLLPRLAASAVHLLLPIEQWANGMIVAAGLVVGGVAALAFTVALTLGRSVLVAVAAALFPVVVPVAGIEGIGNMANVHSFMPYALIAALLADPRGRVGRAAIGVAIAVCVLTDIQTVLLVPLAAVVLWSRGRRALVPVVVFAAGLLIQAASYASIGRGEGATRPGLVEVTRGYLFDGVLGAVLARVGIARHLVAAVGWWPLLGVLLAWLVVVVVVLWRRRFVLLATLTVLAASLASWGVAHYYLNYPILNFHDGPFRMARWGTAPALLLLATSLPVIWAVSVRGGRARGGARLVVAAVVAVQCLSFALPGTRSTVHWSDEVAKGRATCATGAASVTLPIEPADSRVSLPCHVLE